MSTEKQTEDYLFVSLQILGLITLHLTAEA